MVDLKIWSILFTVIASSYAEGPASSTFINTEPTVVGWKGGMIQMPCNFSGTPYAVFWHKLNETDPNSKMLKANFWLNKITSFDERFEMSRDFTLQIRDLVVADEGRYLCQVALNDTSDLEVFTDMEIYAYTENPVIDQCESPTDCTYQWIGSAGFTLDCIVSGFKPNLTGLVWTTADGRELVTTDVQRRLPDGTWERVATISVNAKEKEQVFNCTARGDAVNGEASTTITVLPLKDDKSLSAGGIAGIVLAVLLIVIVIGGCLFWKRIRNRGRDTNDRPLSSAQPLVPTENPTDREIRELREKIKNYKPGGTMTVPLTANVSAVNINLFGLMGVGKSAFFNSLIFALNGTYEVISQEGSQESSGAVSIDRVQHRLTEYINLNDNRGMQNFEISYLSEAQAQVGGERGVDPTVKTVPTPQNEIHCVIFVYEYKDINWDQAVRFVNAFFEAMFKYYGRPPLFVFTHGRKSNWQFEQLKEKLLRYNVPERNISMFENYTSKDHKEDKEKSLKFLEFLWDALKQCDLNINHMDRKKRETPVVEQNAQQKEVAWYWKLFGY